MKTKTQIDIFHGEFSRILIKTITTKKGTSGSKENAFNKNFVVPSEKQVDQYFITMA